MNKNILLGTIAILLVALVIAGYYVNKERNEKIALSFMIAKMDTAAKQKPTQRPQLFVKGQKFADNPLSSKAYLIAPVAGDLSADAQKALTGWTVDTKKNSDGTTEVTLTPKDSDDFQQTYTLKSGYKLYFLEMTFNDEQKGVDENRGDDTGIVVDENGIVQ